MAQFQNMIITRAGLDMIAQSQAGGTLIFTKGKLGDGQIGDQSIPDLTDLINAKMSVELSSVTAKTEGHVEVRFIVDNTDLDVGFFVREVGIFAKVNEEGVEQLYGYANAGNYTNYLADKSVPIDSIITKIDLVVGNASNIAFTTDKSIVYVTLEDLEEAIDIHNKDSNAHEPAFDAHNADDNAHKDMVGATSGVAGKRGMVPAPAAGSANRYLRSDGSWQVPPDTKYSNMKGATSSAAGSSGLVPAPATGDQNKALFGDATYKQVVQKVNGVVADGAGNVTIDIPELASEAEAKAGTNNTKFMTPLRVAQAIPFTALATTIGGASAESPAVIVETKMSGVNWYRRWSDGWLEQGGIVNMPISSATGQKTVTLLKAYKNTNYVLTALPDLTNADSADAHIELDVTYVNKTTTKFTLQGYLYDYSSTADMNWYACGQGA